jgi:hypothetical protein
MILTLLALLPAAMLAQSSPETQAPASPLPERGYLSTLDFGGSVNGDGRIFTLGVRETLIKSSYSASNKAEVGAR